MPELEINGINLPVGPEVHNWNQLLQELESKHLRRGQAIVSVRFDGDEIIQFRSSEYLDRPLHSIGEVRIEAKPLQLMAKDAVQDAHRYLVNLQSSLADVADAFRNQLIDQANSKLSETFQGIKMLVSLLEGIELSLTGQYKSGSTQVENAVVEMGPTLESLIEAQTQQDWILVADILEFELICNLTALEQTVQDFKQKLGAS
jgi:hypothetical protein